MTGRPTAQLEAEVDHLRSEVVSSRAAYARALSRATRLAQVVSAVGQLTDPTEILERAACEVAELFLADIAVFLTPPESTVDNNDPDRVRLAAQWGLPTWATPSTADPPPSCATALTPAHPLVAGTVDELGTPDWLRASEPRHIAWGRLETRDHDFGYLVLARRGPEPFSAADIQELALVVSRVSLAVDNGRLSMRTREQVRRLRRLHEVTVLLAGTLDLDRAIESLAATVVADVPVTGAAVYLNRERGLQLAGWAGDTGDIPLWITSGAVPDRPDVELVPLGVGSSPGILLLAGAPPAGSEPASFLRHLADLGSLVIDKALLFERTRSQAESDTVTGLPNRALLMDRLHTALVRSRLTGSDLALIFVDLDDFKAVNDTHGHAIGDQLLVAVAARLTKAVRPVDTVARFGGDEFVVVCQDIAGPAAATAVRDRLRAAIAAPYQFDDLRLDTRGSVGIGLASGCDHHALTLMRSADQDMYADKERHRAATR